IDTSSGNDGGDISIEGTVDATISPTAVIIAKAGPGGSAGEIDICADAGAIARAGVIDGTAAGSFDLGRGVGADIFVDAVTTLTTTAMIDVSAAGVDGSAGSVDLETYGDITVGGSIVGAASGTM